MIQVGFITYNVYKLAHITYMAVYLVTIIKEKLKFVDFSCFAVYALNLHPNAQTFEIDGRAASGLYQNNELHII